MGLDDECTHLTWTLGSPPLCQFNDLRRRCMFSPRMRSKSTCWSFGDACEHSDCQASVGLRFPVPSPRIGTLNGTEHCVAGSLNGLVQTAQDTSCSVRVSSTVTPITTVLFLGGLLGQVRGAKFGNRALADDGTNDGRLYELDISLFVRTG